TSYAADKISAEGSATAKGATQTGESSGKSPTNLKAHVMSGQDPDLRDAQCLRSAMFKPHPGAASARTLYWARTQSTENKALSRRLTALAADLIICRDFPEIGASNATTLHAIDEELIQPLSNLCDILLHIKYNGKPTDPAQQMIFDELFRLGPEGLVDPLLNALKQCFLLMPRMLDSGATDLALADSIYKQLTKFAAGVRAGVQLLRSTYPRHVWDPPNGIRQLSTILHNHRDGLEPSPYLDWENNWGLKKMEEQIKRSALITAGDVGLWLTDGLNALDDTNPRLFDFNRSVTRGMWGVEGLYGKIVCLFMDTYSPALPGYSDVLAKLGEFCLALARKIRNHLRAPERVAPGERPSRTQTMNAKTGRWRSEEASASKSRGVFAEDTPDDMSSTEALESDWYEGFGTVKDTPLLRPLKERRQARQYMRGTRRPSQPSPVI
ncbi:hypothetical protein HDZ31DRAFT_78317, partial [Schizophyllum fasciatum]